MRAVVQRVSSARVQVADRTTGEIAGGLLVLLGVAPEDTEADGAWLAAKIARLRVFADETGIMNRSLADTAGDALVVSQFTLFASTRKGTRPSFNAAAPPDLALTLYSRFLEQLAGELGRPVKSGEFGAHMHVSLVNDGPVTLILDTKLRE